MNCWISWRVPVATTTTTEPLGSVQRTHQRGLLRSILISCFFTPCLHQRQTLAYLAFDSSHGCSDRAGKSITACAFSCRFLCILGPSQRSHSSALLLLGAEALSVAWWCRWQMLATVERDMSVNGSLGLLLGDEGVYAFAVKAACQYCIDGRSSIESNTWAESGSR